jgi:hypothetical protein
MTSQEQPVRKAVVRALIKAHESRNPILRVSQVEARMKPTDAERAEAQEALASLGPKTSH